MRRASHTQAFKEEVVGKVLRCAGGRTAVEVAQESNVRGQRQELAGRHAHARLQGITC